MLLYSIHVTYVCGKNELLGQALNKTAVLPKEVPSIFQAVGWIAQLGGFLGRKRDGHPGDTTLWRGIHRLNDIVRSWETFGSERQSIHLTPNG